MINYQEGAENSILHGDPAGEAFLSEWIGAQPTLGLRNMNMESLYEYGSRAGFWRLRRTFTERAVPVTVYAVAMALEGIRNDQLGHAGAGVPVRQIVGVAIGVVQKNAFLGDKAARVWAAAANGTSKAAGCRWRVLISTARAMCSRSIASATHW